MNDSKTPHTDAEASDGWSGDAICVSADFARQLERELQQILKERDEARQQLKEVQEQLQEYKRPKQRWDIPKEQTKSCSDCIHYTIGDHEWCTLKQDYPIHVCESFTRKNYE